MEIRRDVFQAIADPTRREIMHLVAHKPLTLNTIARNFKISRPAISQHIKILSDCGLVVVTPSGRERYCAANFQKLKEISQWVDQFEVFWNSKLDALEQHLSKTPDK